MKKARPQIDIDRLREIGWSLWDPIGLNETMGGWKGQPFEDEYDSYLIKAVGMLRNNRTEGEVVDYLFFIETEHMGLSVGANNTSLRENLSNVVKAISEDPSIWSDGLRVDPNS